MWTYLPLLQGINQTSRIGPLSVSREKLPPASLAAPTELISSAARPNCFNLSPADFPQSFAVVPAVQPDQIKPKKQEIKNPQVVFGNNSIAGFFTFIVLFFVFCSTRHDSFLAFCSETGTDTLWLPVDFTMTTERLHPVEVIYQPRY